MAKQLARDIQDKLMICSTCDNSGSNSTEQLVKKNTANRMTFDKSTTKTSAFRLDGLSNALNKRRKRRGTDDISDAATVDVSVRTFDILTP